MTRTNLVVAVCASRSYIRVGMSGDLRTHLESSLGASHTIERELGGGGMARVLVATERALGRRVVIKVLSPELAAEVSTKRFEREILLAAALQQANLVPVLSAGETNGIPHYVMPFVEGLSSWRSPALCRPPTKRKLSGGGDWTGKKRDGTTPAATCSIPNRNRGAF